MSSLSVTCLFATLAVATVLPAASSAQEIASADLTKVTARTDLRRPAAPAPKTKATALNSVYRSNPCFNPNHNAGALLTTLVSLDRTQYQVGDEPKFEVTVENVGSGRLRIPFSVHLGDLQPKDTAQEFGYRELQLIVWIASGTDWSANTGGSVSLYGNDRHPGTMITLNPGESVRVVGKGKLTLPTDGLDILARIGSGQAVDHAYAQASLYRIDTTLTAGGEATVSREICLAPTQGQGVPMMLTDSEP